MKANVEIELQAFSTPNFVRQAHNPDESRDSAAIPLASLDPLTLDRLCREFRREVFSKAGKEEPPTEAPRCAKCRDYL